MHELTVQTTFNATHSLVMYDGQAEPLHGHDWHVSVVVGADALDEIGVVMDFHVLQKALAGVVGPLEQTCLNDHDELGAANPSAERVAAYIARQIDPHLPEAVELIRVSVTEAPGCIATCRP
jgi:6-pyruvoyltetrahydropterin/6-carboxytetrahydropterin synthase